MASFVYVSVLRSEPIVPRGLAAELQGQAERATVAVPAEVQSPELLRSPLAQGAFVCVEVQTELVDQPVPLDMSDVKVRLQSALLRSLEQAFQLCQDHCSFWPWASGAVHLQSDDWYAAFIAVVVPNSTTRSGNRLDCAHSTSRI